MKKRSFISLLLLWIVLGVSFVTIAYASITSSLKIAGIALVSSPSWEINFDNLSDVVISGNAEEITKPSVSNTVIEPLNIVFNEMGASVSYSFDVVNTGKIPAEIGTIIKEKPVCFGRNSDPVLAKEAAELVCSSIKYSLFYTNNNIPVSEGDELLVSERLNLTLKISSESSNYPDGAVDVVGLDISIIYVQK